MRKQRLLGVHFTALERSISMRNAMRAWESEIESDSPSDAPRGAAQACGIERCREYDERPVVKVRFQRPALMTPTMRPCLTSARARSPTRRPGHTSVVSEQRVGPGCINHTDLWTGLGAAEAERGAARCLIRGTVAVAKASPPLSPHRPPRTAQVPRNLHQWPALAPHPPRA
jgi:hypothetical protein